MSQKTALLTRIERNYSFPCAIFLAVAALLAASCGGGAENAFQSLWPENVERVWAGPEYWANPLQDWRIKNGRLELIQPGGDRNVFLLTREISDRSGGFETSVRLGRLEEDSGPLEQGWAGFRVGIRGSFNDYRDSAVRGVGLNAGLAADGRLFIGKVDSSAKPLAGPLNDLQLTLRAEPAGESYKLTLEAKRGQETVSAMRGDVPAAWLTGGLALVCSSGEITETPVPDQKIRDAGFASKPGTDRGGAMRFWFRDWSVSGSKIDTHEDRAFGPILFAMHTLNRGKLKLTAQLAPVAPSSEEVVLEITAGPGQWQQVARAALDPDARTATFRVESWNDSKDTPYRVSYRMPDSSGAAQTYTYEGTVRKDPVDKNEIVVAAFTGNNDLGFPHADIVRNVSHFRPDFLAFTGDNIYERVGEYSIQREPVEMAIVDYLRKWYLFGWEYRELLKDIPAVAIPDDHDVYHGNIWGAGGRHAEGTGYEGQDKGGYTMPARFVNVVQRTQTSNLPDPYDPTPIDQGITVYYTSVLYGGVSFAVIEDRTWKSAPKEMLPKAEIMNGWPQNPRYDAARDGDVPGAVLLGDRQLKFLEDWAADWNDGTWMKTVISQTIFANVATLPKGANTDAITPTLKVMQPGEYAQGEAPVMDHDANSWPQTGRNKALRIMRKASAFHIAGDQHLGSTIQYGIDDWNDAGWAICVPSVANVWPRRWFPPHPGGNHQEGMPAYTGEYLDGFGAKMTVWAVSNPTAGGFEPTAINDRAPGYGIIKFHRDTRKIDIANWPRWVDASKPGAKPYEGWPITIDQLDNGYPQEGLSLQPVNSGAVQNPIVQVKESASGEVVFTYRIQGNEFFPLVRKPGEYDVHAFEPTQGFEQVLKKVSAEP